LNYTFAALKWDIINKKGGYILSQSFVESSSIDVKFHVGLPSVTIADIKVTEWSGITRMCEEAGFSCLWHSNERFYREMWIRMAVAAMSSERLGLGGAVADPFSVHPLITAQSLATISELSNGRACLAIGAGGSGFQMMGIERNQSATALKDAVSIMRPVLKGEVVDYAGEVIQAHKARLQFAPVAPADLWIATRGDKTLEVAGEVADGAIIATYADAQTIGEALQLIQKGATRSGRALKDVRLMSRVDTCVHEDQSAAYNGARLMVAKLLWASYPDRRFLQRIGLTVPEVIESKLAQRNYALIEEVACEVPDEFVARLSWAGTPEMVAERVASIVLNTEVREIGFWILQAPGQSLQTAVDIVATQVIPKVRMLLNTGRGRD
jgi:5,10-methylenetetrahydromethanopterin reductase